MPRRVIAAGLSCTGMASFVVDMKQLGLKTYHMKSGMVETAGLVDLWHKLYPKAAQHCAPSTQRETRTKNTQGNGEFDREAAAPPPPAVVLIITCYHALALSCTLRLKSRWE